MQAIQRQVAILDVVADSPDGGISTTKLCSAVGLPLATVHRLLEGMAEHGMIVQEGNKRWRLGPRVAFWAGRYLEGPAIFEPLRGFTKSLCERTQFFSYLTILDGDSLVCVAVERPNSRSLFFVQLGSRVPVLATAAAKALLSRQPEGVAGPLIDKALTTQTGTRLGTVTSDSYFNELEEAMRVGYAKCMEELETGVSALGAPITNSQGRSVASLSVVAPTGALMERWDETVEKLLQESRDASMMLGSRSESGAASW